MAGGDPARSDVFARLDRVNQHRRCQAADPAFFEPLPGRYLVAFPSPPVDADLERLASVARVRWLYRALGIAEVETTDVKALQALAGLVGVVPAWSTVGATRGVVVGLNALCSFASRQASDPDAPYRHPRGIGYPVVVSADSAGQLELDPGTDLPTPPALVPVVNVSLGTTSVGFPTALNDAVNLATAAASSHVLVVVAAGNCGRAADSMSAWARPDWVLSVGATDDVEGSRIAAYSSRGAPGPDLVAFGQSALNPRRLGTSYAAPRVSHLARVVVAALCELGREVMVAQGAQPMGVPAVGVGIIDDFDDQLWWEPDAATGFQALPLLGVRTDVVRQLVGHTSGALRVTATPAIVREILISAGRPVPGASELEAGAGFVDQAGVIDRLAKITGAEMWAWFGTGPMPDDAGFAQLRPFDDAGLRELASVVAMTGPTVKFDHSRGRWAALPQTEQTRRQSPQGWLVDLAGTRL